MLNLNSTEGHPLFIFYSTNKHLSHSILHPIKDIAKIIQNSVYPFSHLMMVHIYEVFCMFQAQQEYVF